MQPKLLSALLPLALLASPVVLSTPVLAQDAHRDEHGGGDRDHGDRGIFDGIFGRGDRWRDRDHDHGGWRGPEHRDHRGWGEYNHRFGYANRWRHRSDECRYMGYGTREDCASYEDDDAPFIILRLFDDIYCYDRTYRYQIRCPVDWYDY